MITLVNSNRNDLLEYVTTQLEHFFPDKQSGIKKILDSCLNEALDRLETCINPVKMWRSGEFDYLHSSQYAIFLYFLSNSIWKKNGDNRVCTKLFYLNKTLNGIDCFYEIEMPDIFFIGHSVGIVLAKASYGNYLVLYQNSTVGKSHGIAPILGENVTLYPNTAVLGSSHVQNGSVLSQGCSVINTDTPGNCLVFQTQNGNLTFKPTNNYSDLFFDK